MATLKLSALARRNGGGTSRREDEHGLRGVECEKSYTTSWRWKRCHTGGPSRVLGDVEKSGDTSTTLPRRSVMRSAEGRTGWGQPTIGQAVLAQRRVDVVPRVVWLFS